MVGAKLKSLFEAQAKQRQQAGAVNGGSVKPLNNHTDKVVPNLGPTSDSGKSSHKAAELVNVSHGSIDNASKVIKHGAPELVAAVEQGKMAVSTAATIAQLPKAEQQRVVASGDKKVITQAAKDVKAVKPKPNSSDGGGIR